MDNVIAFDKEKQVKGTNAYEALIQQLAVEDKMDRGILMSMNPDGALNILLSGDFLTSEVLYMIEVLKQAVMQDSYE